MEECEVQKSALCVTTQWETDISEFIDYSIYRGGGNNCMNESIIGIWWKYEFIASFHTVQKTMANGHDS